MNQQMNKAIKIPMNPVNTIEIVINAMSNKTMKLTPFFYTGSIYIIKEVTAAKISGIKAEKTIFIILREGKVLLFQT